MHLSRISYKWEDFKMCFFIRGYIVGFEISPKRQQGVFADCHRRWKISLRPETTLLKIILRSRNDRRSNHRIRTRQGPDRTPTLDRKSVV